MPEHPQAQDDLVKSAARAITVVNWLDRLGRPATATEIGRGLGYPSSSNLALLWSMADAGYLLHDPVTRTFRPSPRCVALGHWLDGAYQGASSLDQIFQTFAEQTDETIMLSCQTDLAMLFVRKRAGTHTVDRVVNPGDRAPLFQSAIGLAALSIKTDREIENLVRRFNRRLWAKSRLNSVQVLRQVADIRRRGWSVGYDLYQPNTGAIAWPLSPRAGGHTLVLSVGGDSRRLRKRETAILKMGEAVVAA